MLTDRALPHYRYQDYVNWEGSWELIKGIPFAMSPAPNLRHQRVSQSIAQVLGNALTDCEKCQATLAVDWKIDEHTVVRPDNLVICHTEEGQYLRKAPALIFEILSPATEEKDRSVKFEIYQREGVGYYCIVDPKEEVTKIFKLHDGRYLKEADVTNETHSFKLEYCSIDFDFSALWRE